MIDDMQVYIANLGKYNEGELVGDHCKEASGVSALVRGTGKS